MCRAQRDSQPRLAAGDCRIANGWHEKSSLFQLFRGFEREIFGTVRYMSGTSTGKKFDSRLYMALVANPEMVTEQMFAAATRV